MITRLDPNVFDNQRYVSGRAGRTFSQGTTG